MPVSELPPPAANRFNFNQGIGVLPQFQQPMIDPTDAGNPLNTDVGQMPAPVRFPPSIGGFGAGSQPSQDYRSSATLGYPNNFGNSTGWRDNATYTGNPPNSIFDKISNLLGGIFNHDGPNSAPPTDRQIGLAPSQNAPNANVYNTGRFNGAPDFFTTLAQAQFPGSRIGPQGGGTNVAANNRNAMGLGTPGFAGGYGGSLDSGTSAFQSYVSAHTKV